MVASGEDREVGGEERKVLFYTVHSFVLLGFFFQINVLPIQKVGNLGGFCLFKKLQWEKQRSKK